MDLRAMLNTDGGGAGGGAGGDRSNATRSARAPPVPPQPISTSTSTSLAPSTPGTPVQTGPAPPHSFRDYSHSTHASPVSQPREYPPSGQQHQNPQSTGTGPAVYGSPTSYHPSVGGPYAGRPSVPPLQPLAPQEIRSPGSASLSGPSPYRHTPTSSTSVGSAGYPFPSTQQPPTSPGQRHQYSAPNYPRDGYPSQPPGGGATPLQGPSSYPPNPQQQQQQPIPQTPPVGTPGGSHQYLQQRSLSMHSASTPTSAQSQQAPYPPYAQGSPVSAHQGGTQLDQHLRHQSPQPATPLGPPAMTHRRQSPAMSYQHPLSPYQQRMPSAPSSYQQMLKTSPPPPPPASIPRLSSSAHSAYDVTSASQRRSQSQQSQSERERSISVSPKTRIPSLPSTTSQSEHDIYHPQARLQPQPPPGSAAIMDSQRDPTPAKRKIDDRDLRPEEVENKRPAPPPPNKTNGNHGILPQRTSASSSTMPTAKKHAYYSSPPTWAQSARKRTLTASRNYTHHQTRSASTTTAVAAANIAQHERSSSTKAERPSRHTSPETARSTTVPREEPSHVAAKDQSTFGGQPFPWEPTIEGSKPLDVISRHVADYFVYNVLRGPSASELSACGATLEIEAKLGTIVDRSTNERFDSGIQAGECIVGEGPRIAFRSAMTEMQHRALNGYLNEQVKASFHRNPAAGSRVPIEYVHRREIDRFFELPAELRHRLPPAVAHLLKPNAPLKVRTTYDQKTGNVLASIVKARVADLHIHLAHMPLDCRISVNIEWKWDGPPQEIEQNQIPNKDRQPDRNKDRLSYKQGFYQVDLTQVTQPTVGPQGQPGPPSKSHELEIELDGDILYQHGKLLMSNEPNRYADLVDGLLDNVRVLARRCPPH
ncbi:mRNA triphosphatase CET1 [Poronia punctata]|nr:mRNA triphosphatase CET1 [Poronia punctata]